MPITLYTFPQSSGTLVHWALEELGVPYELRNVTRDELREPAYLAVNPNGKVPALLDADETYFESLAILLHLAERYGVEKGLWPRPSPARAQALSFAVWSQTELHRYMMEHVYHGLDSPVSYGPDQRSAAAAAYTRGQLERHLDLLEERLASRLHLVGEGFTLADLAVARVLAMGQGFGVSVGGREGLTAWLGRCLSRPALARAA
jgi:glutathione S-transferase